MASIQVGNPSPCKCMCSTTLLLVTLRVFIKLWPSDDKCSAASGYSTWFMSARRLPLRAFGCAGMIIFLVPIVGALTTRFSHFDMIHLGSYLSALSPLWIVAFPDHGVLLFSACCCQFAFMYTFCVASFPCEVRGVDTSEIRQA